MSKQNISGKEFSYKWIRAKIDNAEKSGFTNDSQEQIQAQSKNHLFSNQHKK